MSYKERILTLEKNFQLPKYDADVMRTLENTELTAEEIMKKTNIPAGRIYAVLNDLIYKRLINQETGPLNRYNTDNLDENILTYLDYQYRKEFYHQFRMLGAYAEKQTYGIVQKKLGVKLPWIHMSYLDKTLYYLKKDFDIKKNEILIIKTLRDKGELTAEQISTEAHIPKGRIYDSLNNLVENKLIKKKEHKFTAKSFADNLMDFCVKRKIDLIKKQTPLIKKLKTRPMYTYISGVSQILENQKRYSAMSETSRNYILEPAEWSALYPQGDKIDYIEHLREKVRGHKLTLSETVSKVVGGYKVKKKEYKIAIHKRRFEKFLEKLEKADEKTKNEVITHLKNLHKKRPELDIRITDEYRSHGVYVYDKVVGFLMVDEFSIKGITIRDEKLAEEYKQKYDNYFEKAIPLNEFMN